MLFLDKMIHVIIMSAILLIIPGPTNTLLLFSGATSGFFKTQRLILAEVMGYFIAISAWGYVAYNLSVSSPVLLVVIKFMSAIYILYLSGKIWRFQQSSISEGRIKSANVFLTTITNPKALVVVTYILPQEIFYNIDIYPFFIAAFFSALIPVSLVWCFAGHYIFRKDEKKSFLKPVYFYKLASVVLCFFSLSMMYNAFAF